MTIEQGSLKDLKQWLDLNKITEVECIFPDMAGSTKGKILPVNRFVKSVEEQSLKLADSVFGQTVSGKWIDESQIIDYVEEDVLMIPDLNTLKKLPWNKEPTAQIICDLYSNSGAPSAIAPRQVLTKIIKLLEENDLKAIVAPELEFYLCEKNLDPNIPLLTPVG